MFCVTVSAWTCFLLGSVCFLSFADFSVSDDGLGCPCSCRQRVIMRNAVNGVAEDWSTERDRVPMHGMCEWV